MGIRGRSIPLLALLASCRAVQTPSVAPWIEAAAGRPEAALVSLDETCRTPGRCPRADRARLAAERGFLALLSGDADTARANLEEATEVEPLAPAPSPAELARRAYAPVLRPYRPTALEGLSTTAWLAVLDAAAGDLAAARRRAVRFTELRNRFYGAGDRREYAAFGSFVAGIAFEDAGRKDVARAYFDEILATRDSLLALGARVRLTGGGDPMVRAHLAIPAPEIPEAYVAPSRLVVFIGAGRVAPLAPRRVPIEMAWALAEPWIDPGEEAVYEHLRRMGVDHVVIPEPAGRPDVPDRVELRVDGEAIRLELMSETGREALEAHRHLRGPMLAAAVTRAAEGQDPVFLIDPDTRTVQTLPARVYAADLELPAGLHQVTAVAYGDGCERRAATAVRSVPGRPVVAALALWRPVCPS